jgi:hypothetical protein
MLRRVIDYRSIRNFAYFLIKCWLNLWQMPDVLFVAFFWELFPFSFVLAKVRDDMDENK